MSAYSDPGEDSPTNAEIQEGIDNADEALDESETSVNASDAASAVT